ncbi:hypothetical protein V496_09483 [Pseudogymnoascus sp. VKM F-4515 (FW-2607)]|nr:hypothetical protein V496_09483 [Pseudogymnoascus sp. VKM F-4515 (FW-2607)]KFY92587.1 hypothetical protein V498_04849 [Pseudogymnoascus sp. VKM F-4517 (FW-2822)]
MALPDAQSSAYFHTSICRTLCDTIDDLICAGRIEPQLGAKVLRKFVPSFEKAFAENVKAVVTMKGRMKYYRNYENKWWWVVRDCTVKLGTGVKAETIHVDKLRIVGYPTADVPNGKKGSTSVPAGRKTKQGIKQKTKQEME